MLEGGENQADGASGGIGEQVSPVLALDLHILTVSQELQGAGAGGSAFEAARAHFRKLLELKWATPDGGVFMYRFDDGMGLRLTPVLMNEWTLAMVRL